MINYLDVCSGYSAITLATKGLDFQCAGYAEIEPFPAAVLGYHYGATRPRYMPLIDPDISAKDRKERDRIIKSMAALSDSHFGNRIVNFGDFTQIREDDVGPIGLLAGGTPCQAFSIAGKRLGLDDARGNLTLEFLALAKRLRPRWLLWENVVGVLSHDGGRTMGTFLRILGELGYGWAYRVLDVQYIRVDGFARAIPQRRRRVFVVGYLGNATRAAAVLFDRESLRGDSAPRRQQGQGIASDVAPSLVSSGRGVERTGETRGQDPVIAEISPQGFGGGNCSGPIPVAAALTAHGVRQDFEVETFIADIACTLPAGGNSTGGDRQPGTSAETAGTMLVPEVISFQERGRRDGRNLEIQRGVSYALNAPSGGGRTQELNILAPTAYRITGNDGAYETGDVIASLTTNTDKSMISILQKWRVRRLTPVECERLMGVPDNFLRIPYRGKPAADGPIYKACGNSQGVNAMRWICRGIEMVDAIK